MMMMQATLVVIHIELIYHHDQIAVVLHDINRFMHNLFMLSH